jgi:glycosyltransferase involved in cell wall biosynthesis|tara:strand:- start:2283 stop:3299 length:1017 start_codon:yes stop_codon:yes gene_type:complete
MTIPASLIIPCCNPGNNLQNLTDNIKSWSQLPQEILLIDSSSKAVLIDSAFTAFCDIHGVSIELLRFQKLYPGKARNLGIKNAKHSVVAFVDILTLPSPDWLEEGFESIQASSSAGIWGNTLYKANNRFEKLIRACTFGIKGIKTLPGLIVKKSIFDISGLFIESTRAGEDTDWMHRVALHDIQLQDSSQTLTYVGLKDITLIALVQKWYRNYVFSANLPYLTPHKDIYFYCSAIFFIVLAFNWNNLSYDSNLNGWNINTISYLPNVTKLSILFFASLYAVTRGVIIPYKKGVSLRYIGLNFLPILAISMILDITKLFAFFTSTVFSALKIKNYYSSK